MESIGDFLLVVLHCLAHIKTDSLTDDANPMFLRNFYKVSDSHTSFLTYWETKFGTGSLSRSPSCSSAHFVETFVLFLPIRDGPLLFLSKGLVFFYLVLSDLYSFPLFISFIQDICSLFL